MKSSSSGLKDSIGLLGGSFDPIHLGHIHLAKQLLEKYAFKKLYFIPAAQNPLKEKSPRAQAKDRLKLIQAALRETKEPRFDVWDAELSRSGPSYTVDTLREITKLYAAGNAEFVLILGNEVYSDLPKWKEPLEILKIANLCVIERVKVESSLKDETLEKLGVKYGLNADYSDRLDTEHSHWVDRVSVEIFPYCSTDIRRNLLKTWNSNDLQTTPDGIQRSVWLVIKENQLYTVE